jgi:hypothetical protein
MARAKASLGDTGGGLAERVVLFQAVASSLLIWSGPLSSACASSKVFANPALTEGTTSSVLALCIWKPDQSPDLGRPNSASACMLSDVGTDMDMRPLLRVTLLASRSRGSGSSNARSEGSSRGFCSGLATGEAMGDVCISAGMERVVSKTKKASPPSPSFIE